MDGVTLLVHPALNGAYPSTSLYRVAEIARHCIQSEAAKRPHMGAVAEVRIVLEACSDFLCLLGQVLPYNVSF